MSWVYFKTVGKHSFPPPYVAFSDIRKGFVYQLIYSRLSQHEYTVHYGNKDNNLMNIVGQDCPECDDILEALEKIDGEADLFGIDFVKVSTPDEAEKYGILNVPSLVYLRKKTPLVYDGDLTQEDKVLQWLTSQDVFEIKNEIEEVNKKMLDKLLDENEFLAVFFYEHGSKESDEVNARLENIDGETDNLDITFVKMADPRYARKWGVTKLPAIVYFRKRFPSIYRGSLCA
ncbi:uncharacterized protein LOC106643376 [Copidosoma floridanum]|uniref:uncharacterized protein LOC106643376 n=1 Tax=Copidosoma floridanum TaxID=29053 RepID=UPI000C6F6780|nr:uncharacterized protein LOC106643376 [Copidosoma floridanum]